MNYTELKKAIRGYVENDFPTIVFNDSSTTFTSDEQLAVFVQQAEQRIYNSVQFPSLRRNVMASCSASNKYLQCPNDFLAPYSMAIYSYATPTATGSSGAFTITVSDVTNIEPDQAVYGTGIGTGAKVVSLLNTVVTLSVANSAAVSGTVTFQGRFYYLLNKDVNFIREAYPDPLFIGRPRHYAIFGPNLPALPNELTFILGPTPNLPYIAELHYYYYPESITTVASGRTWLGDNFDTVLLYGALQEGYTFIKAEPDMLARLDTQYKEALGLAKRLGDGLERQDAYRSGQVRYPVA